MVNRVRLLSLCLVLGATAFSPILTIEAPRDLGTLGGESSVAHAVNAWGTVVGQSRDLDENEHAFLWRNGNMIDLGTLRPGEPAQSEAYDINALGQVVGRSDAYSEESGLNVRAFLWEAGAMRDLGTLGGTWSTAFAINNRSEIVGVSELATGGPSHAFLYRQGVMSDLGGLNAEAASVAYAINPSGAVAGACEDRPGGYYRACLWANGTVTDLGTFGGPSSEALGINRWGTVVGASQTPDGEWRAFLWRNGAITDLGTLGGSRSWAFGINDLGQVVGYSTNSAGGDEAFLWERGAMTALPGLGGPCTAEAVNNLGAIAGSCALLELGTSHASLWTR